jgi:hypothetical protein
MKGFSNSAVALVLLAVAGAASADALSDCYKTADNRVQVRQCLQKELDRTQRDYADTLAAVKDQAKQIRERSLVRQVPFPGTSQKQTRHLIFICAASAGLSPQCPVQEPARAISTSPAESIL